MRYPGDQLETEDDFRAAEARYEEAAHQRRTDPVYGVRDVRLDDEPFDGGPSGPSSASQDDRQRAIAAWDGQPYSPGDPYLLDRIEQHRAPDGGFHRDY